MLDSLLKEKQQFQPKPIPHAGGGVLLVVECIDRCQRRGLALRSIIISAVILTITALGALAYWFFLLRGPMAGETHHDFGSINIEVGKIVELQHTFHLTNRTGHPVTLRAVRPECGCVATQAQPRTIQPGESLDVPVTFSLSKAIAKTVLIQLDLADAGLEPLFVKATGHYLPLLKADKNEVEMDAQDDALLVITARIYEGRHAPALPIVVCPSGVSVEVGGWELMKRYSDSSSDWQTGIRLRLQSGSLAPDATISIELKPSSPLVIPIRAAAQGEWMRQ